MRCEFISKWKKAYPIELLCQAMKVSKSHYYKAIKAQKIKKDGLCLVLHVKSIAKETGSTYGSRRMAKALQARGFCIGRYAARTLMKEAHVEALQRRTKRSSNKVAKRLATIDNLLDRKFNVEAPNRAWVADITEIKSEEGKFYLASVLDLHSRRIVGYAMARRQNEALVSKALRMALGRRCPPVGCIYHSDRGSQYTSNGHMALVKRAGLTQSLSRPGQCLDNSVKERFFGSLKSESVRLKAYPTREAGMRDVRAYIETFYNSKRLHSKLNYRSPMEFEEEIYVRKVS